MARLNEIAVLTSELVDRLEEEYGEDCKVRTVMMLVEVDHEHDTNVLMCSNDDRSWVQIAFLNEATYRLERKQTLAEERAEEDDV